MRDNGDGSARIKWFRDKDTVEQKLDEGEDYYMNEGQAAQVLDFPDDLNLEECGFRFSDN